MRICYYADGRYIHARRWMRYFAERGHEMHLISFAEMSADDVKEFEKIGVKVHGSTGLVHIKKFWRTVRDLRFVRSVLMQEKIDILHSHYLGANAWFGALSGFHPHIITVMGGGDVTGPGWKPDQNIQSRYLTPYALRHADHITSWSRSMADVVRPYCRPETPIDVVHGGIHLERFTPGEKPQHLLERYGLTAEDRVVFSPRLMRPLSNIIEIAKAAETVVRECPSAYFLVAYPATVTETDYADNVRAAFDGGAAAGRYKFVSEIAHDEIADHFRLADLTVSIPSTDGTPMTVLESMACGTPTVIGDLPDYDREYFENGKSTVMVDVKEPRSIADGILRVLKDGSLAESIAAEARARVLATGGYEFQMAKMESIYKTFAPKK